MLAIVRPHQCFEICQSDMPHAVCVKWEGRRGWGEHLRPVVSASASLDKKTMRRAHTWSWGALCGALQYSGVSAVHMSICISEVIASNYWQHLICLCVRKVPTQATRICGLWSAECARRVCDVCALLKSTSSQCVSRTLHIYLISHLHYLCAAYALGEIHMLYAAGSARAWWMGAHPKLIH